MESSRPDIIRDLGVAPEIDPAAEIERRVAFLVDYLAASRARGLVLGISGGQDSSLAGRLSQLAVERVRAAGGEASFTAIRLPYGAQADEDDAQLALRFIRPDRSLAIDIRPGVDALAATVGEAQGAPLSDYQRGNVKARMRMVSQYAVAGTEGALVVGTDHAAEAVTGFFTKHGDGGADVLPLAGLSKGQGAALLRELDAPARLWEKAPTADLLDDLPGQTDESELGVGYAQIDAFLEGREVDAEAASALEARYAATEHKRRPPVGVDDDWWR
ncbi:ammonia-dependent NAD(+) synthetase [Homoserinibacter sp. YIM 151385]|uniref:ammonia-dependent NAD(+) synthetase n=1 Tax=Homoserinibacter sp. YIM 151385 TaxID=2985506 RepID=UPI0022F13D1B|nr:ammonia-dependent NAD(+) synthetase [Homoserinibacter sp. YIM 151385]WBU37927.1 ammonia-dependent NAD(+) synthetase [Homoserinibacter sp. YIM 151385]